jgi:hypothetical protein
LELRLVEAELRADEVMRPSFWTRLGMTYVLNLRKPALYLSDVVRQPCILITGTSQ